MKKIALSVLAVLSSGLAYALPLGNPGEASLMCDGVVIEGWCGDPCNPCTSWCDMWSIRIGFYGDYVYNRHLEARNGGGDIEDAELFTNAGYLAFNLWNRLDIFATLGTTQIDLYSPAATFGVAFAAPTYVHFRTDFSWSVGGRATLLECGCFALGVEGQYFQTCSELGYVRRESGSPIYFNDVDFRYRDWQAGLGVAYRFSIGACTSTALVPYAGITWAGARFDLDDFTIPSIGFLPDLENKKCWGWAIGVTLLGCDKSAITVEGRFADQKELSVNGQFRF